MAKPKYPVLESIPRVVQHPPDRRRPHARQATPEVRDVKRAPRVGVGVIASASPARARSDRSANGRAVSRPSAKVMAGCARRAALIMVSQPASDRPALLPPGS